MGYSLVIVLVVSPAIAVVVVVITGVAAAGLADTHHVVTFGGGVSVLFAYFLELHPRAADRGAVAVTGSRPLRERGLAFAADRVFGDVFQGLSDVIFLFFSTNDKHNVNNIIFELLVFIGLC